MRLRRLWWIKLRPVCWIIGHQHTRRKGTLVFYAACCWRCWWRPEWVKHKIHFSERPPWG